MQFRTQISPETNESHIQYQHKILMMGSCFTENIGLRLKAAKLQVMINPFGILFNPESIARSIDFILQAEPFAQNNLVYHQGLWLSLNHHGSFSDIYPEICLKRINETLEMAHHWLHQTDYVIVTFGTAWAYRYVETDEVVANCHKLSENKFSRVLLSVDDITNRYAEIIEKLTRYKKDIKFLFTVSPIRHLRDGAEENQVSKSTLILAIHHLREKFANVHYFPSYEIMMDDLRDYRFYEADMVHPSPVAIDYIWDLFIKSWLDKKAINILNDIRKIRVAMSHQPFQPDSGTFKSFVNQQLHKIHDLGVKYPLLDFTEEEIYFKSLTF
jgi:hypothetical protein